MKGQRKLYCSSQDAVEPNGSFLTENECLFGLEEPSSGLKQQVPLLVDTSCLLPEHINCIFILHFQLCRCVCFIDWLLSNLNLIYLIDKLCHSQQAFTSLLSGVCHLILIFTTEPSCPPPLIGLLSSVLTYPVGFLKAMASTRVSPAAASQKGYQILLFHWRILMFFLYH